MDAMRAKIQRMEAGHIDLRLLFDVRYWQAVSRKNPDEEKTDVNKSSLNRRRVGAGGRVGARHFWRFSANRELAVTSRRPGLGKSEKSGGYNPRHLLSDIN